MKIHQIKMTGHRVLKCGNQMLARAVRPAAEGSSIVDVDSEWPNNFQISVPYVPHLEKVYSNSRQKIN